MTTLPTRQQIERAEPLEFNTTRRPSEKDVSICIEAGPSGLTVRVDYIGTLGSIPAAIERLKQAGVLELVSGARQTPAPTNGAKPKAQRVQPFYDGDGQACCPVHRKPLAEGQYGLFCKAKAQPGDVQNDKGYCSLRFSE